MSQEHSKHHLQGAEKQQAERKKQVGVWLDHHQAFLFAAPEGEFGLSETIETTGAEHERHSEHTIHNAEQALRLKHFHSVASHLTPFDQILLFGPGTAQEEMNNLLGADTHFRGKKITVDSASHLTQNQMVAKVRDHFEAAA